MFVYRIRRKFQFFKDGSGNIAGMAKKLFMNKIFNVSYVVNAVHSVCKNLLWLTVRSEHHVMKNSVCDEFLCN